jgi:hypothetical protein
VSSFEREMEEDKPIQIKRRMVVENDDERPIIGQKKNPVFQNDDELGEISDKTVN